MSENPCWGCPNRVVGCHATCHAYKGYDEYNKRRQQENLDRYHGAGTTDGEFLKRVKNAGARKRAKK